VKTREDKTTQATEEPKQKTGDRRSTARRETRADEAREAHTEENIGIR